MLHQVTKMLGYIERTPQVVKEYLERPLDDASLRLVDALKEGTPFVATGCGTSYHMALLAVRYIEALAGVEGRAFPSFDLTHYSAPATKGKTLITISHSGATKATLDAVARTRADVPAVFSMTAKVDSPLGLASDAVIALPGGWEAIPPKTMTYTTGAIQFLRIANEAARRRGYPAIELDAAKVYEQMTAALTDSRTALDAAAEAWKGCSIFTMMGGGPAWITALEASVKMRENNYTACEGFEIEEFAHGRTVSLEAGRPVVCIALQGPSCSRVDDILSMAQHVGAPTMLIKEEGAAVTARADYEVVIPASGSELLSAITAILPLQYFSQRLSLAKGIDPDPIRQDDPLYRHCVHTRGSSRRERTNAASRCQQEA